MKKFLVPKPYSGGLILSYKCSGECKHCMYFGSPKWNANWMDEKKLEKMLRILANLITPSPYGSKNVSLNNGLHFTGGEPFLNFNLLLKGIELSKELNIPSVFVETNCFWCTDDDLTRERLLELKQKGMNGILISVNPFILEYVPFDRTERAIRISQEIFESNVMIYQIYYYLQFKMLNIQNTLPIEDYLKRISIYDLKRKVELFRMGRAAFKLQSLYEKLPIDYFLNENCSIELVRGWHCHFDNFENYMPGYCGGLSWGNIENIEKLSREGINLENFPILDALTTGKIEDLYNFAVSNFDYKKLKDGYISKCHLCFDIRRKIAMQTDKFKELKPQEFYLHI
ncbi:MAG: radical SAM protein [Candidatus Hodarchaeota archaeon]